MTAVRRRFGGGFTLLELMIVVVVVSILTAIAIPSYQEYVRRSNRATAKAALTEVISRQESFRADRKAYSTALANLGYPANLYLRRDGSIQNTATEAIYLLQFQGAASATAFTIEAVPQAGVQLTDKCGTLRVASTGAKTATGTLGSEKCWKS